MQDKQKKGIINRLRRIEGQIRGLQRLLEGNAACLDILTQVSAVTGAVKKAGTEVVRLYLEQCLLDAAKLPEMEREKKKEEFHKALTRYIDMA